ncbi:MAG TPA: glycosyl hydrolase [Steroidobacteraceae bacterium]|nr:glycosyl hydrolase [Steroidobacteraceae bacterium]
MIASALLAAVIGMHDTLGGEQAEGWARVSRLCDTQPQLWSGDFGYSHIPNDDIRLRGRLFEKAARLGAQGVQITLSWHQCNPTVDEPCTFKNGVQKPLSDEEWRALLTDGSALNRRWRRQEDRLASYLEKLQKRGVTVLLRPYHEANIPGFWWASDDAARSVELWRQLHRHFTEKRGLHNLRWVWSVSLHPRYWARVGDYYPGDAWVDVVGVDAYPPTKEGQPDYALAWNTLRSIAPTKPLVLSEVSRLPTAQELRARPWGYVVPWGMNMLLRDNSVSHICRAYTRP